MRRTGHRDAKIGEHSERVYFCPANFSAVDTHVAWACATLCLFLGLTFTIEQMAQRQWNKLPTQFMAVKMRNYAAWLQI